MLQAELRSKIPPVGGGFPVVHQTMMLFAVTQRPVPPSHSPCAIQWIRTGAIVGLLSLGFRSVGEAQTQQSGRQIYQAACASCHGANGTGMPQTTVGFSDAIPDFTDCSYNSREAAQDWQAIVAKGGPVRRFSRRMPSW